MTGHDLPRLRTSLPGPASRAEVDRLARHECPAITARRARRAAALGLADADPVVWRAARGANVEDVDGNVLVDLTGGFGVALVGHAHPAVVEAGRRRLAELPHAMGDAFPDPGRIRLLEALAERTGLPQGILGSSGSDAVEAALKTARLATGRDGVLAFEGAYHGLSYGALAATAFHADRFRAPFAGQLGTHVRHLPWGALPERLDDVGAVLVEPIQGRGGIRTPPPGWLAELARRARRDGALLVLDEVQTGCGRTGSFLAGWDEGVEPDIVCLGKGLTSAAPLSACMGRREVMEAWGPSRGEAIHTQTFLGHPPACAMALAVLEVLDREELPERARRLGSWLAGELARRGTVRGRGMMLGLEVPEAPRASRRLLERGYIVLPAGERAEVLALTPPLTIHRAQLEGFLEALDRVLESP